MVNVIGLGYIGLPTALMMASHGVEVVGHRLLRFVDQRIKVRIRLVARQHVVERTLSVAHGLRAVLCAVLNHVQTLLLSAIQIGVTLPGIGLKWRIAVLNRPLGVPIGKRLEFIRDERARCRRRVTTAAAPINDTTRTLAGR